MAAFTTRAVRTTAKTLAVATVSVVLLSGTAQAAIPGSVVSNPGAAPDAAPLGAAPLFDPHRRGFKAHFRTYGECAFFANHDRKPRTNGWDCRHGRDRVFPWEYWY
jgi:hypothetical protein